jgi:hypothetical protein
MRRQIDFEISNILTNSQYIYQGLSLQTETSYLKTSGEVTVYLLVRIRKTTRIYGASLKGRSGDEKAAYTTISHANMKRRPT